MWLDHCISLVAVNSALMTALSLLKAFGSAAVSAQSLNKYRLAWPFISSAWVLPNWMFNIITRRGPQHAYMLCTCFYSQLTPLHACLQLRIHTPWEPAWLSCGLPQRQTHAAHIIWCQLLRRVADAGVLVPDVRRPFGGVRVPRS